MFLQCSAAMEPIINVSGDTGESSPKRNDTPIENAFDLLEISWFFENLFVRRKPRISSSSSDPCLSKAAHQVFDESPERVSALNLNVFSENGVRKHRNLLRTPSLPSRMERREGIREGGDGFRALSEGGLLQTPAKPPCVERKEEGNGKECRGNRRSKPTRKPPYSHLLRTPSLPPCLGREKECREKETAAKIRSCTQPDLAELLPTRQEIVEKNFGVPRCELLVANDKMWHKLLVQMRRKRSQSELESEEVQGFEDLGFRFDKKDINPTVVNIIPGLREKKEEEDQMGIERVRRPYLSEAWSLQTHLPPIPKWDSKKSSQHMKQEIRFWARAVASNVL